MPRPKARPSDDPAPRPGKPARDGPRWNASLRPDLTGRGLRRLALRAGMAFGLVFVLAALATWRAGGLLDRGGLGQLIATGTAPSAAAEAPRRGSLDRGRLKSLVETERKPAQR